MSRPQASTYAYELCDSYTCTQQHPPGEDYFSSPNTRKQSLLAATKVIYKAAEGLYWFSSNRAVAKSHAQWYNDAEGNKWKLLLRCHIPADSTVSEAHNFRDIRVEDIVILENIW